MVKNGRKICAQDALGHSLAVVLNPRANPLPRRLGGDGEVSPAGHGIEAVVHDGEEDLLDLVLDSFDERRAALDPETKRELDAAGGERRAQESADVFQEALQVEGLPAERSAGLVEDVLNGVGQLLDLRLHQSELLLELPVAGAASLQDLHVAGDEIERRSDLVGEARRHLLGDAPSFDAEHAPLQVIELVVESGKILVARLELRRRLLDALRELLVETLDPEEELLPLFLGPPDLREHLVVLPRDETDLVGAADRRLGFQVSRLRLHHRPAEGFHRSVHLAAKDEAQEKHQRGERDRAER